MRGRVAPAAYPDKPDDHFANRRDTEHCCDRLKIAGAGVLRIAARMEDEAYWWRFHHSIKSDLASRRKRVTLPHVKFLDD
jgi:ATP/maltotriose-dependent transcriptional regulator MalT